MIVACGENLIDMIQRQNGAYYPVVGGSAVNVAMAIGRLGIPAGYSMPISSDALGQLIIEAFEKYGVGYLPAMRVERPTGLALVSIDESGSPEYAFYRHGAADVGVAEDELPSLNRQVQLLHIGGSPVLGNDLCGDKLLDWALRQKLPLSLDPNVRPKLIGDKKQFLRRCERLLALCSVCKISDEDAEYMYGLTTPRLVADQVLDQGATLVVVSSGAQGALLATRDITCDIGPEYGGPIKDTVGAGDCYLGGLLTEMLADDMVLPHKCRHVSVEQLTRWGRFAAAAATVNCMRSGCVPATRPEVMRMLDDANKQPQMPD